MKLIAYLRKLRDQVRDQFKHSVYDAAKFNGLEIEYWNGMPAKFDGRLDPIGEPPKFIAVNPDLQKQDQVYVIAREIARHRQTCPDNSIFVTSAWKKRLYAIAPIEIKNQIKAMDLEFLTYWTMYWHAGKRDFFGFYRRHPEKKRIVGYPYPISDYIFWKLRITNFFAAVRSILRPFIAN